nr:zinc finger, CCHC-type [Tanacetum cinerariifolium]
MNLIGDVKGKLALMVDGMIDTAGLNPFLVGGFSCLCAFMGVGATFMSALMVKKLGILKAGEAGLIFQALLLTMAIAVYWSGALSKQTSLLFFPGFIEEGQSVSSYVLKMKGYIDNLECLGHPATLGLGVSLILIGLRKEFDGFVKNYNMHSPGKTINELHAMLKLHEQTLPKNNAPALHAIRADKVQKVNKHKKSQPQMAARGQNHGKGKNKLDYAPKPKIPPPPKREDPAKDSICHECGERGHWKRNCPQYLAELLKKKKNAASGAGGSGIFVIELNTILNRSWIFDTGCGTHICNTTQGLRASKKLKPEALSLYVGNGQRKAVEAISVFYLSLPSGLEIVLNNCHYAPSITR